MARHDHDAGIHAQILKKRSVHYSRINAVRAALGQAHARHPYTFAYALVVTQRRRTLNIGKAHTLQRVENSLGFAVGFLLLLRCGLPIFVSWQSMVRRKTFSPGKHAFHNTVMRRYPRCDERSIFKAVAPEHIFGGAKPDWHSGFIGAIGGRVCDGYVGCSCCDFVVLVQAREKRGGKDHSPRNTRSDFYGLDLLIAPAWDSEVHPGLRQRPRQTNEAQARNLVKELRRQPISSRKACCGKHRGSDCKNNQAYALKTL